MQKIKENFRFFNLWWLIYIRKDSLNAALSSICVKKEDKYEKKKSHICVKNIT